MAGVARSTVALNIVFNGIFSGCSRNLDKSKHHAGLLPVSCGRLCSSRDWAGMGSWWMSVGWAGVSCGSDFNYVIHITGFNELRSIWAKKIVFYSMFDSG